MPLERFIVRRFVYVFSNITKHMKTARPPALFGGLTFYSTPRTSKLLTTILQSTSKMTKQIHPPYLQRRLSTFFKPLPSILIELARPAEIAIETKGHMCGFFIGASSRGGGGDDGGNGGVCSI